MNQAEEIATLKRWAERLEREHRSAQALLVRNMVFEIEAGAPWLTIMREKGIQIPEEGRK